MNLLYFTLNFLCLFLCIGIIGVNGETKHTEYYDKLGVSPTADGRAIKKGNFQKNWKFFEKLMNKIFEIFQSV